jgi:4-aminobutyrate aminotransferase/4-aminobutyrate aminotransferase/(S)-3-amino-2-methylpropionate transaminase
MMSKNADLQRRRDAAVARGVGHATQRYAVRALNAEIWDADGQRYIDFAGGIGVLNTGHRHPKVLAAIHKQLDAFIHSCFQVMPYEPYIELAEKLNARAPLIGAAKSIFVSTGAEAVENAVKIARAHTQRPGIIAFSGGFHGRTMMGMALTGKVAPYKIGFGPFPADVYHGRFPHPYHGVKVADALDDIAHLFKYDIEPSRVAAFIIEPVQGEGGFTVAPAEFMRGLRALCDEHGILLIADEVQSGFARTGKLFAMEHYDIHADLITVAKSIAGGLPLAGVIGRAEVMDAPAVGGLGGTYGGNPVACAAALAVLDAIDEEGLLACSTKLGERIREFVGELQKESRLGIGEIRGLGGMSAFELIVPGTGNTPDPDAAKALTARAAEMGLILLSCGVYANTIRVLVPLTVEDVVLAEGLETLAKALRAVRG